MVAVKEDGAGVYDLAAIPIHLASQMIDQKITVNPPGKRDQRRDHLHAGAHGVDQVCTCI